MGDAYAENAEAETTYAKDAETENAEGAGVTTKSLEAGNYVAEGTDVPKTDADEEAEPIAEDKTGTDAMKETSLLQEDDKKMNTHHPSRVLLQAEYESTDTPKEQGGQPSDTSA